MLVTSSNRAGIEVAALASHVGFAQHSALLDGVLDDDIHVLVQHRHNPLAGGLEDSLSDFDKRCGYSERQEKALVGNTNVVIPTQGCDVFPLLHRQRVVDVDLGWVPGAEAGEIASHRSQHHALDSNGQWLSVRVGKGITCGAQRCLGWNEIVGSEMDQFVAVGGIQRHSN